MTGHLTPDEQIDSLEGTLGPDRAAHLDACQGCRDDVDRLREPFGLARLVDVPDPSPLFWQHHAARISELVAGEPIQRPRSSWTYAGWVGGAAAAAAAGLLFLHTASTPTRFPRPSWAPSPPSAHSRPSAPLPPSPPFALSRDGADERVWSMVEDLGGEVDGDAAAAALTPATGAADRALEDLDADEQAELVRVLQRELKRKAG